MNRFQVTQSKFNVRAYVHLKEQELLSLQMIYEESHAQGECGTTLCSVHSFAKHAPIDSKYMVM